MSMRDGICPKCGSYKVYSGRDIPVKANIGNTIPIDFQHNVALDNYVCVACGYVESYISDPDALKRIAAQWVDPSAPRRKRKNDERRR